MLLCFSFSIANIPFAVLHVSFSEFVNICINCSPPLHSQHFMIGTFFSAFGSYVLVYSMFITFISKCNSSTYLPGALQSNASYLRAGLPCLSPCASPALAALVPGGGPASASFSTITATVAARIATCMIAVWIASDSAILSFILCNSLPIFLTSFLTSLPS